MRHFTSNQIDSTFLNAFGEPIYINGTEFTGIVDCRPIVIDSGTEGLIESVETFISVKSEDVITHSIAIDSVLSINGKQYIVYNIYNDLSGISEVYVRDLNENNFGEYY
ncbi:hypothetical protein GFB57_18090 [Citrobacter sp. S39]|uniref:hypothetical protein n=1 Tax=Citrobacter TaxID=544 RepID=UPI0012A8D065|nr:MULTISPECIES: hypothetical protein [Citrobacter]MDX7507797.1 hypothetical protein [Citrobacter freundii]QFX90396.1 hypothetical protein GFB57_18090 [Citrobacter sp. S39]